jgi:hypothetical protein
MNSRLGVTATTDMVVLPGVLGCLTVPIPAMVKSV